MLVVGMLRVEGEEGNFVAAGELFEDLVAPDFASHVGGKQAAGFNPQKFHKLKFRDAGGAGGAIDEAVAKDELVRPLGFFVVVGAGRGLRETPGVAGTAAARQIRRAVQFPC